MELSGVVVAVAAAVVAVGEVTIRSAVAGSAGWETRDCFHRRSLSMVI